MNAFVLSGGGNRGAVQAGALLALLERNIRPDVIVGTSVGALNGVALAANPTLEGARWIAEHWRRVRRSDIFPGNPLTVGWRLLMGRGSLHGREGFARFLRSMLPAGTERFADLRIPCIVTATELNSGRLRIFGANPREPLADAIMASTAIPPFFPPYRYGDEWLVDGAVVANLPLAQAISRGARHIYALNIVDQAAPTDALSLGQTMSFALSAMISRQDEQERQLIALGRRRGLAIHDIRLPVDRLLAYNDFSNSAALIDAGYRATGAYLDAHMAAPPARYAWLLTRLREAVRALAARRATATGFVIAVSRLGIRD
jgi:NTE family protein